MQLYFESGRSCTISCSRASSETIGLDNTLRSRLTDLTYDENGVTTTSIIPLKFAHLAPIEILETTVAVRTSVTVRPRPTTVQLDTRAVDIGSNIVHESHSVVGLKLKGMKEIGFVWAIMKSSSGVGQYKTWKPVELASIRDDVPHPFQGWPGQEGKMGSRTNVVVKQSMIHDRD